MNMKTSSLIIIIAFSTTHLLAMKRTQSIKNLNLLDQASSSTIGQALAPTIPLNFAQAHNQRTNPTGMHVHMSVNNHYSEPIIIQSIYEPILTHQKSDNRVFNDYAYPGFHAITSINKKIEDRTTVKRKIFVLTAIRFIEPSNQTIIREISGDELANSNIFLSILLTPLETYHQKIGSQRPPRTTYRATKDGIHVRRGMPFNKDFTVIRPPVK